MDSSEEKSKIEAAILGLEYLLEAEEKQEAQYQQFFEANSIVFSILGYDEAIPFTKESGKSLPRDDSTGLKPEPDFLVKRPDGLWEIFEIKTPISTDLMVTSNKNRQRFTAEVLSYISQTTTYEDYFTRNPANRAKIEEEFGVLIQEDLDIKLVIGLTKQLNKRKVHKKCREFRYKIDIITFDDILNRLEQERKRACKDFENLEGFSFHAVVRFRKPTILSPTYFLDMGNEKERDRISFFVRNQSEIVFSLHDHDGRFFDLGITTNFLEILNEWIYLVCEFGSAEDRFVMTASINGHEMDFRQKRQPVNLREKEDRGRH